MQLKWIPVRFTSTQLSFSCGLLLSSLLLRCRSLMSGPFRRICLGTKQRETWRFASLSWYCWLEQCHYWQRMSCSNRQEVSLEAKIKSFWLMSVYWYVWKTWRLISWSQNQTWMTYQTTMQTVNHAFLVSPKTVWTRVHLQFKIISQRHTKIPPKLSHPVLLDQESIAL